MTGRRGWLAVFLLLILHFSLHPMWSRWPIGPDLVAGGLLLGSFLLRWGRAAAFGCVIGLLEASISLGPLGPTMFLFAVIGCIGAWLRQLLYSESGTLVLVFVFAGTWVLRACAPLLARGETSVEAFLVYAPASAALTTIVCWIVDRLASAGS